MQSSRVIDSVAVLTGKAVRETVEELGKIASFFWRIISTIPSIRKNIHFSIEQMMIIGISSLPIVFVTSIFTGAVISAQAAYQFSDYIPMAYLGFAVEKAITVEMGPVLTALVIAGRIGAAMAAELGTMRVTEQIDAMECLALDPFRFLLAPRMFATLVMLPILAIYSDFFCLLGALAVAVFLVGLDHNIFINGIRLFYADLDIYIGIVKGFVFGGAIALMGCYYGFLTSGGAEGVGISTRRTVVTACVLILILDYIVDSIFI